MTGATVLEPGERLQVDGGYVAVDPQGHYVALALTRRSPRPQCKHQKCDRACGRDDDRRMMADLAAQRAAIEERLEALRLAPTPEVSALIRQADRLWRLPGASGSARGAACGNRQCHWPARPR